MHKYIKVKIILPIILVSLLSALAWMGTPLFHNGFTIADCKYVYIPTNSNYEQVRNLLRDSAQIKNIFLFDMLAQRSGYSKNVRGGRYKICKNEGTFAVFRRLRGGIQEPTRITFNNIRTKEELALAIGKQLEFSEKDFLDALNDSVICEKYGFNTNTIAAMFRPNTYEFYWNTSIDSFLNRMATYYNSFWNSNRLHALSQTGLSRIDVITLASIVEEECYFPDEYPIVAGLYINRLKQGQALQACPTVKFALKDFSLSRVLHIHTSVDSPYNTYKNKGLPPGPIRIPSDTAVDAVLNFNKHSYLYMCAKEDFSGRHNFASSYAEHLKNARRYQAALNKRGIK